MISFFILGILPHTDGPNYESYVITISLGPSNGIFQLQPHLKSNQIGF